MLSVVRLARASLRPARVSRVKDRAEDNTRKGISRGAARRWSREEKSEQWFKHYTGRDDEKKWSRCGGERWTRDAQVRAWIFILRRFSTKKGRRKKKKSRLKREIRIEKVKKLKTKYRRNIQPKELLYFWNRVQSDFRYSEECTAAIIWRSIQEKRNLRCFNEEHKVPFIYLIKKLSPKCSIVALQVIREKILKNYQLIILIIPMVIIH